MPSDYEIELVKSKRLCYECVGDTYLSKEIEKRGIRRKCSYCSQVARSFTIEDISFRVDKAFEQHFTRTSDQPSWLQQTLLSDRESNYEWEREGEPVVWAIANSADLSEEVAQDVQAILEDRYSDFDAAMMGEETNFSSESYYEQINPNDQRWQEEWRNFEHSLKTEARFFSRSAVAHLESIFHGIDKMTTANGKPPVIDAGPQTQLEAVFRARVFQSEEKLKDALCRPDLHLGPPPTAVAVAGRMNARGISVFYGANDPNVAVAEVRPPVGSQVIVAKFAITRPLRLLDLTALSFVTEKGSVFDPEYVNRLEHSTFLRSLCKHMTKPVMPDDEALEYLPTQAISDFLATVNTPVLDGIIFPSVQADGEGLNVVLFHKAARVEQLESSESSEIEAETGYFGEDGWEVDYSVREVVSQKTSLEGDDTEPRWPDFTLSQWIVSDPNLNDLRKSSMSVDLKSIRVCVVRSVQYQFEEHAVQRFQYEKPGNEF